MSDPVSGSQPLTTQARGICPVCRKVGRLFGSEGLLYRHGPHNHPCPGSGRPPAGAALGGPSQSMTNVNGVATNSGSGNAGSENTLNHPEPRPMLKHVPKTARATCCAKLSSILRDICNNPDDTNHWDALLNFGTNILVKPVRGGRRQNIARIITNRCDGSLPGHAGARYDSVRFRDPDATIAAAVSSKIEDGNLRAAIRILSSNERLAPFSEEARSKLQDKHPPANPGRRNFQDPSDFIALSVTEDKVREAIRLFPAGSSGAQMDSDLNICRIL